MSGNDLLLIKMSILHVCIYQNVELLIYLWKINHFYLLGSPWDLLIFFVSYLSFQFSALCRFNEHLLFCYIQVINIDVEQLKYK